MGQMTPIAFQFTAKLGDAIGQVFDKDSEFYIDAKEIEENGEEFMHAVMNLVPARIYHALTERVVDIVEVNHVANRLIMQQSTMSIETIDKGYQGDDSEEDK